MTIIVVYMFVAYTCYKHIYIYTSIYIIAKSAAVLTKMSTFLLLFLPPDPTASSALYASALWLYFWTFPMMKLYFLHCLPFSMFLLKTFWCLISYLEWQKMYLESTNNKCIDSKGRLWCEQMTGDVCGPDLRHHQLKLSHCSSDCGYRLTDILPPTHVFAEQICDYLLNKWFQIRCWQKF